LIKDKTKKRNEALEEILTAANALFINRRVRFESTSSQLTYGNKRVPEILADVMQGIL